MEPGPKVLFSRKEAAAALAVGVSTLDVMVARGLVRAVHFGRRILIHRDEIERAGRKIAHGEMPSVWGRNAEGKTTRLVA